jgi:predicted TIM-barrel fold metal-dependent hydrolase
MEIIDVHAHPSLNDDPFGMMKEMLQVANWFGIEKICLLGDVLRFGGNPLPWQIRAINNLTIALVKEWPKHLIGFCHLNPLHDKSFITEELERCILKEGFSGVKLEVAVNAADSRNDFLMGEIEKLDTVLVHHAWDTTIIGNRAHQSDPEDIALLAHRFPKVRILMAHITTASQRGVLAIKDCLNVWTDTSGGQPVAGTVEYAVSMLGAERVLYGSDVPGRDFSAQIGKIEGAQLLDSEKRMIFQENAKNLFRLQ